MARSTEGSNEPPIRAALKIAHTPALAPRWQREAEALRRIGSPWVPELYAHGESSDGRPYLLMELIVGPTLDALQAPQSPDEIVRCGLAIARSLEAAHDAGLVHRDLKPPNIFLVDGRVSPEPGEALALERPGAVLIDFGVSALSQRAGAPALPAATAADAIPGTALYMAPEQCAAKAIDARADLYALGVILYELACGQPPFQGTPSEAMAAHIERRPLRLAGRVNIPAGLEAAIMSCLAKRPEDRPASANELFRRLRESHDEMVSGQVDTRPGPRLAAESRDAVAKTSRSPEARTVAALFARGDAGVPEITAALAELGGVLAHLDGDAVVGVFATDGAGSPVEAAMAAARALLEKKLIAAARVDVLEVLVRTRRGRVRYYSAEFRDHARFPGAEETGVRAPEAGSPALPLDDSSLPLIGRDRELAALLGEARSALDAGKPGISAVLAEAGLGKSRLIHELGRHLERQPLAPRVLSLRAEPSGASQTFRRLVRLVFDLEESVSPVAGLAALHEALGQREALAVAMAMDWISPEDPALGALAAAPSALRSTASRAVGEALRACARAAPLAVILDNAQRADDATLDALEYAALEDAALPIWICAAARPGFVSARPFWGERAASTSTHRLPPLEPDDARALCRELLRPAEEAPGAAVQRLVARTRGNPLLLVELVRGLQRQGAIRPVSEGRSAWMIATDELDQLPALPSDRMAGRPDDQWAFGAIGRAHAHMRLDWVPIHRGRCSGHCRGRRREPGCPDCYSRYRRGQSPAGRRRAAGRAG